MANDNTFYGHWHPRRHFGKISGNDWNDHFRLAAKPPPPLKFSQRSEATKQHQFSMHDNRHTFCNEGTYFETALGKKRSNTSSQLKSTRNLISWQSDKPDDGLRSTYRLTYQKGNESSKLDVCTQFLRSHKVSKLTPQTQTQSDYSWDPSNKTLNYHVINRPATAFQTQKRRLTRRPQTAMSVCRRDTSDLLKWDVGKSQES